MIQKFQIVLAGVLLALGLAILGIFLNKGLQSFSNKERIVTVRGLAEKEFKATSAKVEINVLCTGDLPKELTERTAQASAEIAAYLESIDCDSVEQTEMNVYDSKTYYTYEWNNNNQRVQIKKDRYTASQTLSFKVADVEKADELKDKINLDLINRDLSMNVSNIYTFYYFADLNSIKPALIAESTKNARLSGEQFAKDSQSKLGKIKTASQGQIELSESAYTQTARVVSSIVFYLED